jgi:hypothetical protein
LQFKSSTGPQASHAMFIQLNCNHRTYLC